MMLNQQMLVQQQHTMTSLISQVDKLSKHVRQNNTAVETVGVRCIPHTSSTFVSQKQKLHDISSCEDVSTDPEIIQSQIVKLMETRAKCMIICRYHCYWRRTKCM